MMNILQEKILTFNPPQGRCKVLTFDSITVIDDTYNANLDSCIAAIDYLIAFSGVGRNILVLGDMLELGGASIKQHEKLGLKWNKVIRYLFYYILLLFIIWFSGNEHEFIYFQF